MAVNMGLPPLVEIDDSLDAVIEFFETQGWTDGLPFVPPTPDRVNEMYQYVDYQPSDVIATLTPRNSEATLERIAINSVMAGCRPAYMPVIITAIQAIAEEPFDLNGMQSTTHPCAAMVLVNGPLARELDINSGHNIFGPGWRANASIGRAMRLIMVNIGGATPGEGDKSTQGSPAKYAFCFAEREDTNPWQPLHVEHGYDLEDSVVTVMAAEGPHNIQDHGSITGAGLLTTIAGSMRKTGGNDYMMGVGGQPMVVLGPEHAAAIAADGFSKDDVKRFIWERARLPLSEVSPEWTVRENRVERLMQAIGTLDEFPIAEHWSRIEVVVAGGAGKHSAWIPTFGGDLTQTVMRRIERADGTPYRSVYR